MDNKAKQGIKQGAIHTVDNDSSTTPITTVTYNGKTSKVVRFSPYGLCTNAPVDSMALLFSVGGQESLKYAISDDMQNRFKNLKEYEVVIYNYDTGAYAYFKEGGDIEVYTPANAVITIDGNLEATIGGDANIDVSGTTNLTSPTVNITGNVNIAGNLAITGGGTTAMSGAVTINNALTVTGNTTIEGKDFIDHEHTGVTSGGSNTGGVV